MLGEVSFSSRRGWSALQFAEATYVLGAPERFSPGALQGLAAEQQRRGRRVLALARSRMGLSGEQRGEEPPSDAEPLGLVVLAERLRPNVSETIAFLVEQGQHQMFGVNLLVTVLNGNTLRRSDGLL